MWQHHFLCQINKICAHDTNRLVKEQLCNSKAETPPSERVKCKLILNIYFDIYQLSWHFNGASVLLGLYMELTLSYVHML